MTQTPFKIIFIAFYDDVKYINEDPTEISALKFFHKITNDFKVRHFFSVFIWRTVTRVVSFSLYNCHLSSFELVDGWWRTMFVFSDFSWVPKRKATSFWLSDHVNSLSKMTGRGWNQQCLWIFLCRWSAKVCLAFSFQLFFVFLILFIGKKKIQKIDQLLFICLIGIIIHDPVSSCSSTLLVCCLAECDRKSQINSWIF